MTAHPRPTPAAQRPKAPMIRATLPLSSITTREDVLARPTRELDHGHVREMADTVRRRDKLDDLLVWIEEDREGTPTGRHVLLDGEHRRAAYRAAWGRDAGSRKVPVSVLKGTLMEAQLHALLANVRRKLGLTKAERMDRAWQLVWEHGYALSKDRLAGAAQIGVSTVGKMRKRWTEMREAEQGPPGSWWKDSRPLAEEWSSDVPQARRDAIKALVPELRKLLRRKPQLPTDYLSDVLADLLGPYALAGVVGYLTREELEGDPGTEGDDF